jgi:hypothetical protein
VLRPDRRQEHHVRQRGGPSLETIAANRGPAIVASAASEPIWMCRIRRGSGSAIALSAAEIPRFLTSVSSELEVIARFGDKTVKIRGA